MPTTAGLAALYAQSTGEILVPLVTLTSPEWSAPVRLAAAAHSVISRGQEYLAAPLEIVLPEVGRDGYQPGRLVLLGVSPELAAAIRALSRPIEVTIEFVLGSTPDTVEIALPGLEISAREIAGWAVEVPLVVADVAATRYPADQFSPATFPGLAP